MERGERGNSGGTPNFLIWVPGLAGGQTGKRRCGGTGAGRGHGESEMPKPRGRVPAPQGAPPGWLRREKRQRRLQGVGQPGQNGVAESRDRAMLSDMESLAKGMRPGKEGPSGTWQAGWHRRKLGRGSWGGA